MTDKPAFADWYVDALKRRGEIVHGALPPGAEDIESKIATMTGDEVNALDASLRKREENRMATTGPPYQNIMGYTKDGHIAYFGLHTMGAKKPQDLLAKMDELIRTGDAELKAYAAEFKQKVECFLRLEN
jgi:hypothetical protein